MKPRNAQTLRQTKETRVYIQVRLDGPLGTKIKTGLPFFDHMLDSLAVHGRLGLDIDASGDLKVDPHHTIEDCGIVLGTVIAQAMVDVKGVKRAGYFGFPMDGSLAVAAVDLCGRPNLVWKVEFGNDPVGGIAPGLFRGFFKGLADGLRATLHVNVPYRDDDHHAVEAIFKAFGRALREALTPTGDDAVPSTKGAI